MRPRPAHLRLRNGPPTACACTRRSRWSRTATSSHSARGCSAAASPEPDIDWGPGLGDDIAQLAAGIFLSPNYSTPAQAIYHTDGSRRRVARRPRLAPRTARSCTPASTITTSSALALNDQNAAAGALRSHAVPRAAARRAAASSATTSRMRCGSRAARAAVFLRPEGVRRAARRSIPSWKGHQLRHVLVAGGAAAGRAQVGARLHRQLGLVDHRPDILINLAMFPLRQKSVISMRRMQEMQPQMKAIQERYAKYKITDPSGRR